MKEVKNIDKNKWKIVLVMTIDSTIPIYYRLVNLSDYEVIHIPAYRILDDIINKRIDIINAKCVNNSIVILNDDDYESMEDIVIIDVMDEERQNIFEWSLNHPDGSEMISKFDGVKNAFSPSSFQIDSTKKIAWTCKNNHTIHCDFPTFFGINYKCPICEMEDKGYMPSLNYWANITNNREILEYYDSAEENLAWSTDIGWRERRKVFFKKGEELKKAYLNDITAKSKNIGFSDENSDKSNINLSR